MINSKSKYFLRRISYILFCICFQIVFLSSVAQVHAEEGISVKGEKSAQDVVNDMGIGWCLGNTLDSTDCLHMTTEQLNGVTAEDFYETRFDNIKTTKAMIDCVKAAGFGAVRVPVSYQDHMDAIGTIDEAWLNRVAEVVSYIVEDDMYCIINIHWEYWLKADPNDEMIAKYEYVWKQISDRFVDVGDKLLFESMNEVRNSKDLYDSVDESSLEVINQLNQKFVNIVRITGGENSKRFLIVVPYTAFTLPKILQAFKMPEDTLENHLIAEVHSYADLNKINWTFTCIDRYLIQRDIPVILGEFGQRAEKYSTSQRADYLSFVLYKCDELGIAPFWWDTGGKAATASDVKAFALFNRNNLTWYFPELIEIISKHENMQN